MSNIYSYFYNPISSLDQFNHICVHSKKNGILRLRQKSLIFESLDSSLKLDLKIDEITSIEQRTKENGELIQINFIATTSNDSNNQGKGFVFRFFNYEKNSILGNVTNKRVILEKLEHLDITTARNKLFDLLQTRNFTEDEVFLKQCFTKKLSFDKQNEILSIINNNALFILFNEFCLGNILRYEEFCKFVKKKYNSEFLESFSLIQNISLASKFLKYLLLWN